MADQSLPSSSEADWNPASELVVATEHIGFVREHLGSCIRKEEHSTWLGLSRLLIATEPAAADLKQLLAATPTARQVKKALTAQAAAVAAATGLGSGRGDQLSRVLQGLRALAIAQHGGWMPTIGRNRLVELPGSGDLAVTNKTSYGAASAAGGPMSQTDNKTSYGDIGASGSARTDNKTSYGGSGAPRSLSGKTWEPPAPRSPGPGAGVRVGLVDTRVWPHPWLAGGWSARASDLVPVGVPRGVAAGHGTFVAGLVLSQAPGAQLEVRHGLDEDGTGTTWRVAQAMGELSGSGVSVINLSFACYTDDGQPPLVLARAVDRVNSDVVVVAAAGNHAGLGRGGGKTTKNQAAFAGLPSWPAALDDVVAVGSLDRKGRTAPFSPDRPWVDVAVRGVDLRSTFVPQVEVSGYVQDFGPGWAEWSGTSFSAALLSGAIAAGVDPGRVSALDAAADLIATAAQLDQRGRSLVPSAPRRLALRTTGWARPAKGALG